MASLKRRVFAALRSVPGMRGVARRQLENLDILAYPVGHFHSVYPDPAEIRARPDPTVPDARQRPEVAGIDLNEGEQLEWLERFRSYYQDQHFPEQRVPERRYYFENGFYSYHDALALFGMLRALSPARVVEIGSGFSSCLMLDTLDALPSGTTALTFIEPHTQRLRSNLRPGDLEHIRLIEQEAQDVPMSEFTSLRPNDILFIDSSHVSKHRSDVNYLFFEILPRLQSGVYIHIHDIFYPFDYPTTWMLTGRCWNEAYLLRALLIYSSVFRIVYFNHFMATFHREALERSMPLAIKNPGGSIWLRRV